MITLQEAIERARIASDEDGIISSYLYDQLTQALPFEDRHSFTMNLVDLGIQTKLGSNESRSIVGKILDKDIVINTNFEKESNVESWEDRFKRLAQRYVQSPSGLWVPEDDNQDQGVEDPGYEILESTPINQEFDTNEIDSIIQTLENSGIHVDQQGNVTLYKQNVPGLYTKKIPLNAVPIEQAIDRLNSDADNLDKEQNRISVLQDILSTLNSDFQGVELDLQDLMSKFNDSLSDLDKFKYSQQSTSEEIRSIAESLNSIRGYLDQSFPSIEELKGGLSKYESVMVDLQSKLDNYYQEQYNKYDEKIEVIDALERLNELKDSNPSAFQQVVSDIGGV